MADAPATTNAVATFVNGLISAAMTGGEVAVEAYITALDPAILAIPIVQDLLDELVSSVGDAIYGNIAKIADAIVFDIQTNGEASTAAKAATTLANATQGGDQNAIAQATQGLINAYGSLIHSDGTTTIN